MDHLQQWQVRKPRRGYGRAQLYSASVADLDFDVDFIGDHRRNAVVEMSSLLRDRGDLDGSADHRGGREGR